MTLYRSGLASLFAVTLAACSAAPEGATDDLARQQDELLILPRQWASGWTVLNGATIGDATLASVSTGKRTLFARGLNDRLFRWDWDSAANAWGLPRQISSTFPLSSSPVAVARNGRLEIFARGGGAAEGSLIHWSCDADPNLGCTFTNDGGWFYGKPAVVATAAGIDLFVASNRKMFHRSYLGSAILGAWVNGPFQQLAYDFDGQGSAAAWKDAGGVERISVIEARAQDRTIRELRFENGDYPSNWTTLPGGGLVNDAPTVINDRGNLRVFGRGLDDAIWWQERRSTGWSGSWSRLDACTRGSMAALGDNGRIDLVIIGKSEKILHNVYDIFLTMPAGVAATCCGPSYGNCCLQDPSPQCAPFDVEDPHVFGYEKNLARGPRALVTVILQDPKFPGHPPVSDIRAKVWGGSGGGLGGTVDNVQSYTTELSNGVFSWKDAGTFGPFSYNSAGLGVGDSYDQSLRQTGFAWLAATGFDFAPFDTNGDRVITDDELVLLMPTNDGEGGGAVRYLRDYCLNDAFGRRFCFRGRHAAVGRLAGPATYMHELIHVLTPGAPDIYGNLGQDCGTDPVNIDPAVWAARPDCTTADGKAGKLLRPLPQNQGLSLMASPRDPRQPYMHLDPWYKMRLGWVKPRVRNIRMAGVAQLQAPQFSTIDGNTNERPVLLFDPDRGTKEFFLLEYRTRHAGTEGTYDQDATTMFDVGLAIWQVRHNADNNPTVVVSEDITERFVWTMHTRGAPLWTQGGATVWNESHGPISLKWGAKQIITGVNVRVKTPVDLGNALPISWQ